MIGASVSLGFCFLLWKVKWLEDLSDLYHAPNLSASFTRQILHEVRQSPCSGQMCWPSRLCVSPSIECTVSLGLAANIEYDKDGGMEGMYVIT